LAAAAKCQKLILESPPLFLPLTPLCFAQRNLLAQAVLIKASFALCLLPGQNLLSEPGDEGRVLGT
jgi:hypothetical protein